MSAKTPVLLLPHVAAVLVLLVVVAVAATTATPAAPFTVFGYLPEYRLRGYNYDAAFQTGLTHLIYFSLEVDPRTHLPKAKDRLPTLPEARQARAAADKVGGKLLISFGGNSRSLGFAEMVATPHTRAVFLEALDALLRQYNFDGVDYNWEYPRNAEEWQKWALLLRESKQVLRGGDQNIVTFTMYLDPHHADVIQRFNMLEHADYVHCMAYDQHGEHSTFEFAVSGAKMAKSKGIPLHKFTLGVPFYARHTGNGEPKTYGELMPRIKASERWTLDRVGPYYFNSPAMLQRKTELALDFGLGGVMIWELGQDVQPENSPHSLMQGILKATSQRGVAFPALKKNYAAGEGDQQHAAEL